MFSLIARLLRKEFWLLLAKPKVTQTPSSVRWAKDSADRVQGSQTCFPVGFLAGGQPTRNPVT